MSGIKQFNCEICEKPFVGQWTDFFGEATCITCGTPYQLLKPSGAGPDEVFPHFEVKVELVPIFKEYWVETHRPHREGIFLGDYGQVGGQRAFRDWMKVKHPELVKE